MGGVIHISQRINRHFRVDLRRLHRLVPKKLLHHPVSHARRLASEGDSENLARLLMALSGDHDES